MGLLELLKEVDWALMTRVLSSGTFAAILFSAGIPGLGSILLTYGMVVLALTLGG